LLPSYWLTGAVADAYEDWHDLEDDEVISILQNFKEST
jgi:predicted phosphoribosyltransferase